MKRGTIYWVNFAPSEPPEFGKTRPALVVSSTEINLRLSTVVVIPLSTKTPAIWPLRIPIKLARSKESFAVLPGIRQIAKSRIKETIGLVSVETMSQIDEALAAYLSE